MYIDLHPAGRSSATGRSRCKFCARFFDVCGAQRWLGLAYHKPSSLIRLALYSLTFSVIIIDQLGRSNGQLKPFTADALTMLMMTYIVYVILQYVVLSDAKHQKNTRQILVTSQALEASDKLKRSRKSKRESCHSWHDMLKIVS